MQSELADLMGLLAAPLGAGVAPSVALAAALAATARAHPRLERLFDDLDRAARQGRGAGAVWLRHAGEESSDDLDFVARAWLLTERTGAPLAEALSVAESVLRARVRARARVDAAAAGPRASMTVLLVLPLSAPLVGLAFGLTPADLYLTSPLSGASACLGVLLAGLGWWWGRRILARALGGSDRRGGAAIPPR